MAIPPPSTGSDDLIAWIEAELRGPGPVVVALRGEPGAGKTALLRRLSGALSSPPFLPAYLDLAGCAGLTRQRLLMELGEALGRAAGGLQLGARAMDPEGSVFHLLVLRRLRDLLGEDCRPVILLDHVDRLSAAGPAGGAPLLDYLHGLLKADPRVSLVLALGPPLGPRPKELSQLLRGARTREVTRPPAPPDEAVHETPTSLRALRPAAALLPAAVPAPTPESPLRAVPHWLMGLSLRHTV